MLNKEDHSGFTLIEVLFAVVILSIIMIGLHQVMNTALSAYEVNRSKQDLLAHAHYAVERMSRFVEATDSIIQPDTIDNTDILQVSERLVDTYNNAAHAYLIDGDGLLDADNDYDGLVNEGGGDTAETITFSLDKTDPDNWKLTETIPDYDTAVPDDLRSARVICEHVTAFASRLVAADLVEIELTLENGSETAALKTRARSIHLTSYVGPTDVNTPPTPDPMTWASFPAADSLCPNTATTMTASLATDNKSLVEYYFECTAGGGHHSGWQDSTLYRDTGLDPDTAYTYRVKARDKSMDQNETAWSAEASATTGIPAPITFDAVSTSPGGDTTTESWFHTVTSAGDNRILIVGVAYAEDADKGVESVTYGGQNLIRAGIVINGAFAGSEIWYVTNPPTGTNTVVVTMKDQVKLKCGAISFLNVDQANPFDTFYSDIANSDTPTIDIPSVNEFDVVVDHLAVETDLSTIAGSGQTWRWTVGYASDIHTSCSTEDGPVGGGSVTMSWDIGVIKKWALGAVVLKPVACD